MQALPAPPRLVATALLCAASVLSGFALPRCAWSGERTSGDAPEAASSGEPGLVACYDFNEGAGALLHDRSSHGNHGHIHGARFVPRGGGSCLEFDGVHDYVDCGNGPSLDLRESVTLEAWVCPEARVPNEPGILGKHFESYLLSYYADGKCWWYVSGGGNNAKALLTSGSWHHVVGTFDGAAMKLYVDGKPADIRPSQSAQVRPGRNFFIGCVLGDANATDPNYARTAFFPGLIDEVRVYSRALSAAEVQAHFIVGVKELALAADYRPAEPVHTLQPGGLVVKVSAHGQVQLDTGQQTYLVESAVSFPGPRIGWNKLAGEISASEEGWTPTAKRLATNALEIAAQGHAYRLQRRVNIANRKVEFEDELTNLGTEPVGFIVRHSLTAPTPFREAFAPGGAENPTIFLAAERDSVGLVAEDGLSRLRFEPSLGLPANQARFRVANFALGGGQRRVLRWAVYVLPGGADYFDFVNQVRRDWGTVLTIDGPFAFFDVGTPLLERPENLRAYLRRKRLAFAALSPWLDYDPGSFERVWPRGEYQERMQRAVRALKAADPAIRCLGCVETDWVTIYPERIPGGERLPSYHTGSGLLNAEQTRILDAANLPWKDSVKRRADGNLELELYSRGGKSQTALSVYPRVGNHQHEFLLGQVQFLLDEVGLDGFYIDEFSQGWRGGIPSYEGWDGVSAEVDPRTGLIQRRYVDCSLAGVEARVRLCQAALQRGKVVVANTYATAPEEQALPVFRFAETQGAFDPMATPDGAEPPGVADIFRGNLATPIGLGIVGQPQKQDTARRLTKALITYLRHGAVYYHYALEDVPELGPGSGEYGPINHMFPLTPLELHQGWIVGQERIITAVSHEFRWRGVNPPKVLRFDLTGRQTPADCAVTRDDQGWKAAVRLNDWAEIIILE